MGRRQITSRFLAASALSLCTLGLLGCQSEAEAQRAGVRFNPSPDVMTPTLRDEDIDNQVHYGFDTNWRNFNRDLGVLFLTDKPSRLSPYPVR